MPIPAPARMKPGSSAVHFEFASMPLISSNPRPTSAMPRPNSTRTGTVRLTRPAAGATKKLTTVSGRNRRPVCWGENPSVF